MLAHPPTSTRVVGVRSPAPPSQAPVMPAASSATVDAMTRLINRTVWLAMNAAASRGTPAGSECSLSLELWVSVTNNKVVQLDVAMPWRQLAFHITHDNALLHAFRAALLQPFR